jgi:hypothetical protein
LEQPTTIGFCAEALKTMDQRGMPAACSPLLCIVCSLVLSTLKFPSR